ncbi:aldo/keto reductase [Saxibacter everestensis]|uniref:Aldo/keto reductase n=1 Tax=Saxibacter everestensis TaxID=2909229 RepID=A0ABY8QNY6_9MICO|nr:aldo/keto reductase [Brevibacteriaceae bacterium ZFBP1038]
MELTEILAEVPVPSMAVGTMYFGTTVPAAEAHSVLDVAHEQGAWFWDTANNYAFWAKGGTGDESEKCLGDWLATRGPRAREEVMLATKVGARPRPGSVGLSDPMGLSAAALREQLTDSLKRLNTAHVDVLYAHIDDRTVPLEETVGVLGELQAEGLTRAIAASNLRADRLAKAVDAGGPSGSGYAALQQRFTYLVPDSEADLSPHVLLDGPIEQICINAGIAMLGYSPLLSGAYTRDDRPLPDGYATSANDAALGELHSVSDQVGLDAGQVVLAWMGQRDRPVLPVIGLSGPEQVDSALHAVSTALPVEALTRLDAARSSA